MPQGTPTARVFIWYPHVDEVEDDDDGEEFNGHVGHASLYIGNYQVGKNFELSLDPNSPDHVLPSALEQSFGLTGAHFNENYVSWWPNNTAQFWQRKPAQPALGLYKDVKEENSDPHVVYDLYGLDVAAMRVRWEQIREKPGATYQFLRKSCATVVMDVLQAGGVRRRLGHLGSLWFGRRLYWTPKRVAAVCDRLRDADFAVKTKAGNCPSKDEFGRVGRAIFGAMGLR